MRLTRRGALGAAVSVALAPSGGWAQASAEVITLPGGLVAVAARPARTPSAGLLVLSGGTLDDLMRRSGRLAEAGYLAIAPKPDGTARPPTPDIVDAGTRWLVENAADRARLGVIGFGAGGSETWTIASRAGPFRAAVAWSGIVGIGGDLVIPLLGLYAGDDPDAPRAALLRAESTAKAAKRIAEMVTYAGAGTELPNDRTPVAEAATQDGWARTLAWFRRFNVA